MSRADADAKAQAKADADAKAKADADALAKANADAIAKAKADALASTQGVRIGMTTDQVINSTWGRPNSINRTTTANGESEQWVYGDTIMNFLYFENGILTDIQN